jgi:hypothetical protein
MTKAEKDAAYYKANRDQIRNRQASYYRRNRVKFSKRNAEYRKAHKEKTKDYLSEYQKSNRDKLRKYLSEYYKANRDEIRNRKTKWRNANRGRYQALSMAYNARKRQATIGDLTEIAKLYERARELRQWFDVAVDHTVPLSKGGTHEASNLQILYVFENCSKQGNLNYKPRVIFK